MHRGSRDRGLQSSTASPDRFNAVALPESRRKRPPRDATPIQKRDGSRGPYTEAITTPRPLAGPDGTRGSLDGLASAPIRGQSPQVLELIVAHVDRAARLSAASRRRALVLDRRGRCSAGPSTAGCYIAPTAATLMLARGTRQDSERADRHSTPMLKAPVYSHVTPTMPSAAAMNRRSPAPRDQADDLGLRVVLSDGASLLRARARDARGVDRRAHPACSGLTRGSRREMHYNYNF